MSGDPNNPLGTTGTTGATTQAATEPSTIEKTFQCSLC